MEKKLQLSEISWLERLISLVGDSGKADLPAMYRLSAKLALTPVGSESDEELLSLPGPDNALINTLYIFKPAAFTLVLGTCRQIRTNYCSQTPPETIAYYQQQ